MHCMNSYFLLQVISDGVTSLQEDTTSEYGHTYLKGTKLIRGHYLNYQKTTREGLLYKKSQDEAIVPSECILYCGIDLQIKKNELFLLDKEDHEDIMCSIAL